MWMNGMEIESAKENCKGHEVLGPATYFLWSLMEYVDTHSDGWAHWPIPGHAAEQLMQLIKDNTGWAGDPRSGISIKLKDVEKTLSPIKRMATVQAKTQKKYGNTFDFNVEKEWKFAKERNNE